MNPNKIDATPIPTESVEQQHLFRWAQMASGKYPELELMYKIPNEGKRGRANASRMKAEGLKSGVPDICLPVARDGHHGLYIELKRSRDSRVTPQQMEWIEALVAQGYVAAVCRGCEEAIQLIVDYLGG